MPRSSLDAPTTDPTPIFEHFRGAHATELLTAAVAHFDLFGKLADGPRSFDDLRDSVSLAQRPAMVLFTAMRAMNLLETDSSGRLTITDIAAEHLVPGSRFDVGAYLGLAAESPGVLEMVERLKTNTPAGANEAKEGAAFIFREGIHSAMEQEASARSLTLALAGRAKNVAPFAGEKRALIPGKEPARRRRRHRNLRYRMPSSQSVASSDHLGPL